MVAYVPVIVMLLGLLLWLIPKNEVVREVGRWMFIVGLFWTVGTASSRTVQVFR